MEKRGRTRRKSILRLGALLANPKSDDPVGSAESPAVRERIVKEARADRDVPEDMVFIPW